MKVPTTLSLLLAAGLARASTTACNADNCARQITGTRAKTPDLAVRQTDCANFMTTTVYATPTATTTPAVVYQNMRRRDGEIAKRGPVTVSGTVPAYATDCTGVPDYSSACSCWGFTATVITIATPTTTVAASTPTCYQGLQWAFYSFTDCGNNPPSPGCLATDSTYPYSSEYSPEVFEFQTPAFTGTTGETGGVSDGGDCDSSQPLTVFGQNTSPYEAPYTGIQQRGYFVPQLAGTYTFTANGEDEIVLVWVDQSPPYTVSNAVLVSSWAEGTTTATYTVTAGAVGVAVPFRIQWANAQGCANFDLTVTDPNNAVILGSSTTPSDIFLQYCVNDGNTAPQYPAWASETY